MRRFFIVGTALVGVTITVTNVNADFENLSNGALGCYTFGCGGGYHTLQDNVQNCSSKSYYCYYDFGSTVAIATCSKCDAGYSLTWADDHIGDCSSTSDADGYGSSADYRYTTCTCSASECANVGTWLDFNTKFQRRAKYTCQSGSCKATGSYEYRCATGYWGSSTNGTSGCSQCPAIDDKMTTKTYGTSTPGANTAMESCHLVPGTYEDTTGTFTITGANCNYKL